MPLFGDDDLMGIYKTVSRLYLGAKQMLLPDLFTTKKELSPTSFTSSQLNIRERVIELVSVDFPCYNLYMLLMQCFSKDNLSNLTLLNSIRALCWERLHSVSWEEVDIIYRQLYALSSSMIILSLVLEKITPTSIQPYHVDERHIDSIQPKWIISSLRKADIAQLLADPISQEFLEQVCQILQKLLHFSRERMKIAEVVDIIPRKSTSSKPQRKWIPISNTSLSIPLPRVRDMDILSFYENYFLPQDPVVIVNSVKHWPALQHWCDLSYILKVCGDRLIPVETCKDGSFSYLSSDSGSSLITMRQYIHRSILDSVEAGYVAQTQVPIVLKKDIDIPDFTSLQLSCDGEDMGAGDEVIANIWFGPSRTVSPLHHDCYYNLLTQVVGYKYVRLFHPSDSECLSPLPGRMKNNSSINLCDASVEDMLSQPWGKLHFKECLLGPGDMLFIPRGYWHHVQAVTREVALDWTREHDSNNTAYSIIPETAIDIVEYSISVNFWWGKRITTPISSS